MQSLNCRGYVPFEYAIEKKEKREVEKDGTLHGMEWKEEFMWTLRTKNELEHAPRVQRPFKSIFSHNLYWACIHESKFISIIVLRRFTIERNHSTSKLTKLTKFKPQAISKAKASLLKWNTLFRKLDSADWFY